MTYAGVKTVVVKLLNIIGPSAIPDITKKPHIMFSVCNAIEIDGQTRGRLQEIKYHRHSTGQV